jgi:hypothetical protein
MVHHIDLSWNTIEPSLILMYKKLVGLGFVYNDGKVTIYENLIGNDLIGRQ